MVRRLRTALAGAGAAGLVAAVSLSAQQAPAVRPTPPTSTASLPRLDASLFRPLTWRAIGPYRAGRVIDIAGIAGQLNTFLAVSDEGGGLWRTTDAGRTWRPLFDDRTSAVVSAFAVAPSSPAVIYAGTGDGLFRSADAGQTWARLGLPDVVDITDIAVDGRDANRVVVAVGGDRFADDARRGVYGSTDGGRVFTRLLASEAGARVTSVQFAPGSSTMLYAGTEQSRRADGLDGYLTGAGTAIHLSEDAGRTWRVVGGGLPTFDADGLARLDLTIAPALPARVFAVASATRRPGLYRSDDAGVTFARVNEDARVFPADDAGPVIAIDPKNADVVYAGGADIWRSTDGGRTFVPWRNDPGLGHVRRLWLSPASPEVIALATDGGAIVSVNGGETWSSADNQPTASLSSVAVDTAFPYRVCGGSSAQPPVCVASRGDDGRITSRDWRAVSGDPSARVAVDPLDPEIVYSGAVVRFDRRTSQAQAVPPPPPATTAPAPGAEAAVPAHARRPGNGPMVFAPSDGRTVFFGGASVWRSSSGGVQWTELGGALGEPRPPASSPPGLSRGLWASPLPPGVSALAVSSVDGRVLWAGTNDGKIHLTRDTGTTWRDVTPADVLPWQRVASIEASRFDPSAAYVAVQSGDPDAAPPRLLRTRDAGVTWEPITGGLPRRGLVNAVREDAFRRGLLFAATQTGVHLSFDDGASWQSLRLNLPAVAATDVIVKDGDVVIATAGRGFWILDDIGPLRQVTPDVARADAFLFRPATAWRVRSGAAASPAMARDEPAATNPPEGVVLSYLLGTGERGTVTLEVIETTTGETIRTFTSAPSGNGLSLDASAGLHRVVWDLRFPPPPGLRPAPGDTSGRTTPGVDVLPGTYQVRLTVNGRPLRQAVAVRMDPRVRTSIADLTARYKLARSIEGSLTQVTEARVSVERRIAGAAGEALTRLRGTLIELDGAAVLLSNSFHAVQSADAKPTVASEAAAASAMARATVALDAARALPAADRR